jgi:hypothetical protein
MMNHIRELNLLPPCPSLRLEKKMANSCGGNEHRAIHLLKAIPAAWLLEGEPWVRYRVLTELLDRSHNDSDVVDANDSIAEHELVKGIYDRRNAQGYWGTPKDIHTWWPKVDTTFWVLGILGEFGLTRKDERIARACEYVFGIQLPDGGFGWDPPTVAYDCHTAILVESLATLGYGADPRLHRAYQWLMGRQRLDGGFWCKQTGQIGRRREREPSCAMASMFVAGALALERKLSLSETARKVVEFLLSCWENRDTLKYAGHDSQIGRGWEKLKFPFTDYRILKHLDVLSRFEHARRDPRMGEMIELLASKADSGGRFSPESIHKAWSDFDFGQKKRPSRWITYLVYRILKRSLSE